MKEQHDLAKWLEGKMTENERVSFENTAEFAVYDKIKRHASTLKAPKFDSEIMFEKIIRRPKAKPAVKLHANWVLQIAAVLVIGLGLFFAYHTFSETFVLAQNGKTASFELPDDSEVMLNSGSEIKYQKFGWNQNRSLQLEGEAFFKVTKGKTFDVKTTLGKVTVVGTQFNVKARGQRFEVTCFEGKVRVQNDTETVLITKGQRITFDDGSKINSVPVHGQKPLWLQNELAFNSEKLSAVVAELERIYDISIKVENVGFDKKFTGTIPSKNLDLALKIVSAAYQLEWVKNNNLIILKRR